MPTSPDTKAQANPQQPAVNEKRSVQNEVVAAEETGLEDEIPPEEQEQDFPEGGLRAWLVVLGCWLSCFGALGFANSMATIHAYISRHQLANHGEGSIGWIFSLWAFLSFFCGIYVGPIFDKYGPKWLLATGGVCVVACPMLLSICTEYWSFILVFGVLNGIGGALLLTPSYATVGHWFKQRRGLATGIASTGSSFGGMVYPIILRVLFEQAGWRWGMWAVGLINLFCCVCAFFLVRTRLSSTGGMSLHPDLKIFRDAAFSLATLGVFLMEFALFIPMTYVSSYALRKGFGLSFSYQIPTILNAASICGRILAGWWGDQFGAFNSHMLASILCCTSCLAIWLPTGSSLAGLVVFVTMFGFGSGSHMSMNPVCIGKLCGIKSYGRYWATSCTVASFAGLIGVPLGGQLISGAGGEYWSAIVFAGCLYGACGVTMYAAKGKCVGWKPWVLF
ncbi:hypothetical protein V2G26_010429 [Clonostachys chloroleuca]